MISVQRTMEGLNQKCQVQGKVADQTPPGPPGLKDKALGTHAPPPMLGTQTTPHSHTLAPSGTE